MIKFVFWDNWGYEQVEGFSRELQPAAKDPGNPLLIADRPWEHGNITLYGSVLKAPGRPYQLWYSVIEPRWHINLAYAESEDGIHWVKPELDLHLYEGKPTNIVLADNVHGPAIIYDEADPRPGWKYKMVCGAAPTSFVYVYHSGDGIHWQRARPEPIIGNNPDCPMALLRRADGRYAVHHRVPGGGRRIGRSESEDFLTWHGGRIVLEPGPGDPPQFQMYGMGSAPYGDLEIGSLWDYVTDPEDMGRSKMCGYQETEFTYSRNGLAWHRPTPRQAFIPHGASDSWDSGNVQAASAPVFLEDEIRYYYAASTVRHHRRWELSPGRFGIGMARIQPDRFLALTAGDAPAEISTRVFELRGSVEIRVNADIAPGGSVRMELLDAEWRPIPGFEMAHCVPLSGDAIDHLVRWQNTDDMPSGVGPNARSAFPDGPARWRIRATKAKLYSLWMPDGDAEPRYYRFVSPF
jgi:hypothetical protein